MTSANRVLEHLTLLDCGNAVFDYTRLAYLFPCGLIIAAQVCETMPTTFYPFLFLAHQTHHLKNHVLPPGVGHWVLIVDTKDDGTPRNAWCECDVPERYVKQDSVVLIEKGRG